MATGDISLPLGTITFLSTPPSRVATLLRCCMEHFPEKFLSTPPSRVATKAKLDVENIFVISIHATLAGGDERVRECHQELDGISIHATLAGGDLRRR